MNPLFRRVPTSRPGFPQFLYRTMRQTSMNRFWVRMPMLAADPQARDSKNGLPQSCTADRETSTKPIQQRHLLPGPRTLDLRVKDTSMFLARCQCQSLRHQCLQPRKRIWTRCLVDWETLEMQTPSKFLHHACSSTPLPSHNPVHSVQQMTTLPNSWIWTTQSACKRHHLARPTGNNFTALRDRTMCQTRTCTGGQRAHLS